MYPDDRVLVGVIRRKRDLVTLKEQRWYRIPQKRMSRGVYAEYLAFFLSGYIGQKHGGSGIHYYARRQGVELAYRRDLLPDEADNEKADEVYYKVQVGEVIHRVPPITNVGKRNITFIHATWDRFLKAQTIRDLYSDADYFVDRIYHALQDKHYRIERYWEPERRDTGYAPQIRVLCDNGAIVVASTESGADVGVMLDVNADQDEILRAITDQISRNGGPVTLPIY